MNSLTESQLRVLGHDIADKADNYLEMAQMPGMPLLLTIDALKQGLEEIRENAHRLYVEVTGENPWEDA